jgi:hypothetical protein
MSEKEGTETASTLLDAVVSAELGLRDLENTCASLEDLITEGRGLVAEADGVAPAAPAPATPEPSPQPLATTVAQAAAPTEPEPEPEPVSEMAAVAEKPATKRSLEEQAAALRAAMESVSKPPEATPEASSSAATKSDGKHPNQEAKEQAQPLDRRPFLPKRTSPLRSRLAREEDGSPTPQEGESYSDRSAELEQLLRSERHS